jgi:hypothetical protein
MFAAITVGGACIVAHWGIGSGFVVSIGSLAVSAIAALSIRPWEIAPMGDRSSLT